MLALPENVVSDENAISAVCAGRRTASAYPGTVVSSATETGADELPEEGNAADIAVERDVHQIEPASPVPDHVLSPSSMEIPYPAPRLPGNDLLGGRIIVL